MDNSEVSIAPDQGKPFWMSWKIIVIFLIVVLLIAGLFGLSRVISGPAKGPDVIKPDNNVSGWPTYTNHDENFIFSYPPGWTVSENESGLPAGSVLPTLIYKPSDNCTPKISIVNSGGNMNDFAKFSPILFKQVSANGRNYTLIAYTGSTNCALSEESAGNTASALSKMESTFKSAQ